METSQENHVYICKNEIMKKQLLIVIMLTLPFFVTAQDSEFKSTQLGFSLTPNIGWLRFNDNDPDTEPDGSKIGFSYGVLADLGLSASKNYYFSTAFTLTSINTKAKALNSITTYKIQYIEVPLTLKLKSNGSNMKRFYGQFGLGTGLKIGAKSSGYRGTTDFKDENITKSVNAFRLSLIAGAGAEWTIDKSLALQTGLTFNNGFTDIIDDGGDARSSYLALNLGIFF